MRPQQDNQGSRWAPAFVQGLPGGEPARWCAVQPLLNSGTGTQPTLLLACTPVRRPPPLNAAAANTHCGADCACTTSQPPPRTTTWRRKTSPQADSSGRYVQRLPPPRRYRFVPGKSVSGQGTNQRSSRHRSCPPPERSLLGSRCKGQGQACARTRHVQAHRAHQPHPTRVPCWRRWRFQHGARSLHTGLCFGRQSPCSLPDWSATRPFVFAARGRPTCQGSPCSQKPTASG